MDKTSPIVSKELRRGGRLGNYTEMVGEIAAQYVQWVWPSVLHSCWEAKSLKYMRPLCRKLQVGAEYHLESLKGNSLPHHQGRTFTPVL